MKSILFFAIILNLTTIVLAQESDSVRDYEACLKQKLQDAKKCKQETSQIQVLCKKPEAGIISSEFDKQKSEMNSNDIFTNNLVLATIEQGHKKSLQAAENNCDSVISETKNKCNEAMAANCGPVAISDHEDHQRLSQLDAEVQQVLSDGKTEIESGETAKTKIQSDIAAIEEPIMNRLKDACLSQYTADPDCSKPDSKKMKDIAIVVDSCALAAGSAACNTGKQKLGSMASRSVTGSAPLASITSEEQLRKQEHSKTDSATTAPTNQVQFGKPEYDKPAKTETSKGTVAATDSKDKKPEDTKNKKLDEKSKTDPETKSKFSISDVAKFAVPALGLAVALKAKKSGKASEQAADGRSVASASSAAGSNGGGSIKEKLKAFSGCYEGKVIGGGGSGALVNGKRYQLGGTFEFKINEDGKIQNKYGNMTIWGYRMEMNYGAVNSKGEFSIATNHPGQEGGPAVPSKGMISTSGSLRGECWEYAPNNHRGYMTGKKVTCK